MSTYAYLRVSTTEQETEKNKDKIFHYANFKKFGTVEFIEETISGTKKYKERELGKLLNNLKNILHLLMQSSAF